MTEWLTAIGSFGQFVVVSVASAFAVVQLRQIRRQVDLQSIESLFSYSRSAEFERLIDAVNRLHAEGSEAWSDASRWDSVDFKRVVRFAMFGNELSNLVAQRLLSENPFLPIFRFAFLRAWDILRPWLADQRYGGGGETINPRLVGFEALIIQLSAETFVDRFAVMRAALPPALRPRYDESNMGIRALYRARYGLTRPSKTTQSRAMLHEGLGPFALQQAEVGLQRAPTFASLAHRTLAPPH